MDIHANLNVYLETNGERWRGVTLTRLRGREAISDLFHFDVEIVVLDEHDLGERAYPGGPVTVVFERDGLDIRRVHGMLTRIVDRLEDKGDHRSYELRIGPRAEQLSLVETQEIFLGMSVPEVLKQKLEMHTFGGTDFELRFLGDYPKREIIVQFGESDLAFIRRLCEHVGIAFFFEHHGEVDKWVFTDHPNGFGEIEGTEEIHFVARAEQLGVFALQLTTDLIPGTFIVQDYNYRTPLLEPTGQFSLEGEAPGGIIEYGEHVKTPDEARALAKVRAEECLARKNVYRGKSSIATLASGKVTKLLDHPRLGDGAKFLVTEVEHELTGPASDAATPSPAVYRNTFRAISAELQYRPERRTPKPRMAGVVTGIIQPGPGGEVGGVARLTNDGRYTVQLHFDSAPPGQQKASHPIRMAQPFAGHGNAMHFPLLPGTEVIIAFANGDPDRPVIVGALPNPLSPTAVAADEATKHRIRTSKGVTIEFGSHSR